MSRKLDDLVATRVMNWVKRTIEPDDPHSPWEWWTARDGLNEGMDVADSDWSPSTDIAAAWLVFEKIKLVPLEIEVSAFNTQEYYCSVQDPERTKFWDSWESTAPLAICKTALRALGVTESEITAALE